MKMRIAFREEGTFWNAYLAHENTMDGAYLLGSILMDAVRSSPELKQMFMDTMKLAFSLGIERATGQKPEDWQEKPAPDSERKQ